MADGRRGTSLRRKIDENHRNVARIRELEEEIRDFHHQLQEVTQQKNSRMVLLESRLERINDELIEAKQELHDSQVREKALQEELTETKGIVAGLHGEDSFS